MCVCVSVNECMHARMLLLYVCMYVFIMLNTISVQVNRLNERGLPSSACPASNAATPLVSLNTMAHIAQVYGLRVRGLGFRIYGLGFGFGITV